MEAFSALLAIGAGNSPVTGELLSQRPVTWCFILSVPEQTVELKIETLVIWDAIMLIMTSLCLEITTDSDALQAPYYADFFFFFFFLGGGGGGGGDINIFAYSIITPHLDFVV